MSVKLKPRARLRSLRNEVNPAILKRIASGQPATIDWLVEQFGSADGSKPIVLAVQKDSTKSGKRAGEPISPDKAVRNLYQGIKLWPGMSEYSKRDAVLGPLEYILHVEKEAPEEALAEFDSADIDALAKAIAAGEAARSK